MVIDLSNYEDVATLNKWFVSNYPMGSLQIIDKEHKLISNKEGQVIDEIFIVTTGVFRDVNDLHPAVMNIARGRQSEYPKHMQRFYAEDVTTSSYGRCLALLKASDKTATKDDMRKVDDYKPKYSSPGSKSAAMEMALHIVEQKSKANVEGVAPIEWAVGETVAQIGEVVDVSFTCRHGDMVKKVGVAKATNKPYAGYVCTAAKPDQCEAKWAKLTSAGTWYWPDDSELGKGGE
jgi:hypothetical protein